MLYERDIKMKIIKRGSYYRLKCPKCGIIFWCRGHCSSFQNSKDKGYFGFNGECKCGNCDNSKEDWKQRCDFQYKNDCEPFIFR
jgi:hypothetical protein